MKITLKQPFKSLQPFTSEELNDFTIITGKNGSGKSQLLELIEKAVKNTELIEIYPFINFIRINGLEKKKSDNYLNSYKSMVNHRSSFIFKLKPEIKKIFDFIVKNKLENSVLDKFRNVLISNDFEYIELINNAVSENLKFEIPIQQERFILKSLFYSTENENVKNLKFISYVVNYTGKNLIDIDIKDMEIIPIDESLIEITDLFESNIENIFYCYALRRDLNRRAYFDKMVDGDDNGAVSDSEFVANNKPPWETYNDLLKEYGFDFYFNEIEKKGFDKNLQVQGYLCKRNSHAYINFEDLSSGEKIFIGLITKLFTSSYFESFTFPDLMLLDEPDAYLHPELSKMLLDVLYETFVKKYKIKIIMTTHSPTTIALAPEECIYKLKNHNESALKKVSKDSALRILTVGIPTLSIDYKNHRQVFVESPTDVKYFQVLFEKYSQEKELNYNLYFISNAMGKGNCDLVKNTVNQIRDSGNKTSFGIIDRDKKNKSEEFVFVHGENERYSIENFVLDPVYLICLLIENNNAYGILGKIGYNENFNQYLFGNEPIEKLQEIYKVFFNEFEGIFKTCKYDSERIVVEYLNCKKVEMPKWYLEMKGHDIVTKLKAIFPVFGTKYPNEGDLQNELIRIMGKCYPYVPLPSIQVFEKIGID